LCLVFNFLFFLATFAFGLSSITTVFTYPTQLEQNRKIAATTTGRCTRTRA
jgi:Na+-transporting methylmalonyl-CoA/oxaloacetate decarboxylase gamma subunit